jgi:hypothetical protein
MLYQIRPIVIILLLGLINLFKIIKIYLFIFVFVFFLLNLFPFLIVIDNNMIIQKHILLFLLKIEYKISYTSYFFLLYNNNNDKK